MTSDQSQQTRMMQWTNQNSKRECRRQLEAREGKRVQTKSGFASDCLKKNMSFLIGCTSFFNQLQSRENMFLIQTSFE